MRGDRSLLRIGGYLIGLASRLLPGEIRDERRREWTAELPAILRDPDIAAPIIISGLVTYIGGWAKTPQEWICRRDRVVPRLPGFLRLPLRLPQEAG